MYVTFIYNLEICAFFHENSIIKSQIRVQSLNFEKYEPLSMIK